MAATRTGPRPTAPGAKSTAAKRRTLFEDVVTFWRSQLNFSVVSLQKALVRNPSLEDEHLIYLQLASVEECLSRTYYGSDAFYAAVVADEGVPLAAICQILALMLFSTAHLPTFSHLVWRSARVGKLVRLVCGVPAWSPALQQKHKCTSSASVSVLDGLHMLSAAAEGFMEAGTQQPGLIQSYLLREQVDGDPKTLLYTCQSVARGLMDATVEIQEMVLLASTPWEPPTKPPPSTIIREPSLSAGIGHMPPRSPESPAAKRAAVQQRGASASVDPSRRGQPQPHDMQSTEVTRNIQLSSSQKPYQPLNNTQPTQHHVPVPGPHGTSVLPIQLSPVAPATPPPLAVRPRMLTHSLKSAVPKSSEADSQTSDGTPADRQAATTGKQQQQGAAGELEAPHPLLAEPLPDLQLMLPQVLSHSEPPAAPHKAPLQAPREAQPRTMQAPQASLLQRESDAGIAEGMGAAMSYRRRREVPLAPQYQPPPPIQNMSFKPADKPATREPVAIRHAPPPPMPQTLQQVGAQAPPAPTSLAPTQGQPPAQPYAAAPPAVQQQSMGLTAAVQPQPYAAAPPAVQQQAMGLTAAVQPQPYAAAPPAVQQQARGLTAAVQPPPYTAAPPAVQQQTRGLTAAVQPQPHAEAPPAVQQQASELAAAGSHLIPEQVGALGAGAAGAAAPVTTERGLFSGLGGAISGAANAMFGSPIALSPQSSLPLQPQPQPPVPKPPLHGTPAPPAAPEPGGTGGGSGRKLAVLIGCNYPGTQAELRGCCNDVAAMRDMLLKYYGFSDRDVTVLVDVGGSGAKPTGHNIKTKLAEMVRQAQDGDELVVHFSGHGSQVPTQHDRAEADGKDEVLVPCDMNFISDNDLKLIFDPLHTRPNAKLTFIADCCHSGTLLDMKQVQITGPKAGGPPPPDPSQIQAMQDMLASGGASSSGDSGGGKRGMATQQASTPRSLPPNMLMQMLAQQAGVGKVDMSNIASVCQSLFGSDASASLQGGLVSGLQNLLGGLGGILGGGSGAGVAGSGGGHAPSGGKKPSSGGGGRPTPGSGSGMDIGVLLSGCQEHETSADVQPAGGGAFGAFTNALTTVVRSHWASGAQHPLTYRNLVLGVREALARQKTSQSPCLECSDRWVDQPFILH